MSEEMYSTGPVVVLADDARPTDLAAYLEQHRLGVRDLLLERGAVLFRGFAVGSAERFHAVARAFLPDLRSYVHGNSPRHRVTDRVYTSTEYPSQYPITLHNELSYTASPPSYLMFCCLVPADSGGETRIADGRRVLDEVSKQVDGQFMSRTIKYTQNLPDGAGFGKSWQDTFETEDANQVTRILREDGVEFEWKPDGGLRTTHIRDAVALHPSTGERVWFNQADQWHWSNLDEHSRTAMLNLFEEDDLPINASFGDGSAIDPADLDQIRRIYGELARPVRWQASDVLVIDNWLTMHGRAAYTGPREVLVAMG